jgi:hypothetical protein
MTRQWRTVPTYTEQLIQSGNTSSAYYRFMHDVQIGNPPSAESLITVSASPFTYTAPQRGVVIINGGTVSQVSYIRVAGYVTGQTAGMFTLGAGDQLVVTYSGLPTMTFAPL